MGKYKDDLIKKFNESPVQIGDIGYVSKNVFNGTNTYNSNQKYLVTVINILDNNRIIVNNRDYRENKEINVSDFEKSSFYIGYNPFNNKSWQNKIKTYSFDIEGILLECGFERKNSTIRMEEYLGAKIYELNFNPYVFDKDGKKQYYQRDFVWSLKEKQLLIDSLYNGVSCGTIIVRKRSFEWLERQNKLGNTELAFNDIIDGKQRLNAILEFVNDNFPDSKGRYFSDFSDKSKVTFMRLDVISYKVLDETSTDEDALNCFILTNTGGVTISESHIEKVKKILL